MALPSAPLATEACAPSVPVVEADRDGNLLVQWQTPPWAVGGNGRADAGTFELQWRISIQPNTKISMFYLVI